MQKFPIICSTNLILSSFFSQKIKFRIDYKAGWFFTIFQKKYTCRLNGDETSTILKVTTAPHRFIKELYDSSYDYGSNVELICELNKALNDIEWSLDGKPVREDRRHAIKVADNVSSYVLYSMLTSVGCRRPMMGTMYPVQ